ncbi:32328_t:CDS:1, partial [Racocetra persica]
TLLVTAKNKMTTTKKRQPTSTDSFIKRIDKRINPVIPSYNPITPGNSEDWKEKWKNYNLELHKKIAQEKLI